MEIIILTILVFIDLIYYIIIIDVILSWLSILGIDFRLNFIKSILEPIYEKIRNNIPTNIGPLEFTPVIIILAIVIIKIIITYFFPDIVFNYNNFIKF